MSPLALLFVRHHDAKVSKTLIADVRMTGICLSCTTTNNLPGIQYSATLGKKPREILDVEHAMWRMCMNLATDKEPFQDVFDRFSHDPSVLVSINGQDQDLFFATTKDAVAVHPAPPRTTTPPTATGSKRPRAPSPEPVARPRRTATLHKVMAPNSPPQKCLPKKRNKTKAAGQGPTSATFDQLMLDFTIDVHNKFVRLLFNLC